MKNDTTTTPDAIVHTLTLDRAETQAIAQKYLETLPEGDRPFAAALAQSVSALFGMMQLPMRDARIRGGAADSRRHVRDVGAGDRETEGAHDRAGESDGVGAVRFCGEALRRYAINTCETSMIFLMACVASTRNGAV